MFDWLFAIQLQPIDWSFIYEWGTLPIPLIMWEIVKNGGWIVFFFVFFFGLKEAWLNYIQQKTVNRMPHILLAVDVPRDNEQSPKAVENIFSQMSGLAGQPNFIEKYWLGETPVVLSLEIVSIDGYVQFLIYCVSKVKDFIESAIYAQYPDAEITEVTDYVNDIPRRFPDENYELFGTELILAKHAVYPIRTYPEFEHGLSQEFKDPMASLLENMSRLQIGEQVWLQILISPTPDTWKDACKREIKKFLKQPVEVPASVLEKIIFAPVKLIIVLVDQLFSFTGLMQPDAFPLKKDEPFKIMNLTPGDKEILESMERKISKIGFEVKIRLLYAARKEIFSKVRGVASVIGAIKQFNTLNLNAFKPDKRVATKVEYFLKRSRVVRRQNKLMYAYRNRDFDRGSSSFILNIEELASIYHFPALTVKAPLLKRTTAKRAEPPVDLPITLEELPMPEPKKKVKERAVEETKAPPVMEQEQRMQDYFAEEREDAIRLPTGSDKEEEL
ncbi:MAG: hypothetical protein HY602_00235 [Parcubacteria group bacterium]|nr:hypothetical protein [Parcubacteria group bacterium]